MQFAHILILFLLLFYRHVTTQKVYECQEPSSELCILKGVEYTQIDGEPIILPEDLKFVQLIDGKISKISEDFYNEFGESPVNFTVTNCGAEQLYVSPQFVHLNATGNRLKTVTINSRLSYRALKVFIVSNNQLRRMPNIKDLVQLEHLDVSHNFIDYIDLNVLQRLTHLKILNLAGNKINSLDGPFQLSKLTELRLNNNELQEINLEKWNMSSLEILDLSLNLLMYLNGNDIIEPFPKLRYLGLPGNQWNCRAMTPLLDTLNERAIKFMPDLTVCPANWTSVRGLCCQDSYVNWVTLHSQWEIRRLERTIQTLNDTLLQDLARVKNEQGEQVLKLEKQLDEQEIMIVTMKGHLLSMEGVIEDLIEELYLREVEKAESKKVDDKELEETPEKLKLIY